MCLCSSEAQFYYNWYNPRRLTGCKTAGYLCVGCPRGSNLHSSSKFDWIASLTLPPKNIFGLTSLLVFTELMFVLLTNQYSMLWASQNFLYILNLLLGERAEEHKSSTGRQSFEHEAAKGRSCHFWVNFWVGVGSRCVCVCAYLCVKRCQYCVCVFYNIFHLNVHYVCMLVQHFEPQSRRFTNVHYYYNNASWK